MEKGFNIISKTQLEDIMVETQIKAIACESKEYDYHLNNLKTLEGIYQRNFIRPSKHIYN